MRFNFSHCAVLYISQVFLQFERKNHQRDPRYRVRSTRRLSPRGNFEAIAKEMQTHFDEQLRKKDEELHHKSCVCSGRATILSSRS